MHRRTTRITRERAIWVGLVAVVAILGGGIAYAALPSSSYNCTKTDTDTGFDVHCVAAAPSDSPTPAPSATQTPSPSPTPTVQPSPTVSPTTTTAPPTTTPPPSPSPSPTAKDCLHNLAACGFPNAANTGPTTSTLAVVSGNVTLSTAGMVYEGKDVRGCVEVRASNVTIKNSRIVGNCFYVVRGFSTGLTIVDTELSCNGANGTAIVESNFVARRVDIHNCENGLSVTSNVVLEDSWIHDMEIDDGAHTDGVQINQGASGLTFRHNSLIVPTPGATSAIISWDEGDPQQQKVLIDANLLSGGTYVLYCPRQGTSDTRVTNNRFADPEYGYSNACTGTHVSAWSGNVVDATNAALGAA